MRRYDDPVEVRQGWIGAPESGLEGPEQFLWRGRLWQVRAVLAHWVETGAWWQSSGARAVIGSDEPAVEVAEGRAGPPPSLEQELLVERELWRVEAGRGRPAPDGPGGPDGWSGVFDLSFSWADGCWQLVGCAD